MTAGIPLVYELELDGWRKLWARLRGRPWRWRYEMDVVAGVPRSNDDGTVTVPLRVVSPVVRADG